MMGKQKSVPSLRFDKYTDDWSISKLGKVADIKTGNKDTQNKVDDGLYPFFVRSNTIERINSYSYDGEAILTSGDGVGVGKNFHYINGKFDFHQRVYSIRNFKLGFDGKYIYNVFSERFYKRVMRLSAKNSVDSVRMDMISEMEIYFPALPEQQKIATFLSIVDEKITLLKTQKSELERYKKGVMQKVFSQELRFKDEGGKEFPKWEKRKLSSVLFEHKFKSNGTEEVFSVSVHKGLINQIEHLGRSFSAANTDHYNLVKHGDIVYTKSPTGDFPLGIIKQSDIEEDVIVSPLYGVFTPETKGLGYMLHTYFESHINVSNYLSSIIQKGAKNTINITNTTFLSKSLFLPTSKIEQEKIGGFLQAIQLKIDVCTEQITKMEAWKKGLLQQMFC